MILLLDLTSREQDELMQALSDHKLAFEAHGNQAPKRKTTTENVITKIRYARSEHEARTKLFATALKLKAKPKRTK